MCVNSNWFIVLFKPYVSLLIFYLFFYPLSKIEYIRFSNYCLIVSFSLCSVSFCFMYFGALLLGMCCWAKLLQLYLTLCDPMDCSLPGSSVHGILQARILEWVAISFSSGSFPPTDRTCISMGLSGNTHWGHVQHLQCPGSDAVMSSPVDPMTPWCPRGVHLMFPLANIHSLKCFPGNQLINPCFKLYLILKECF